MGGRGWAIVPVNGQFEQMSEAVRRWRPHPEVLLYDVVEKDAGQTGQVCMDKAADYADDHDEDDQ